MHYEALKQSAFDPRDGTINIDILATGLSTSARKQRMEVKGAIKKNIEGKGKVATVKYQMTFEEVRQQSEVVSYLSSKI